MVQTRALTLLLLVAGAVAAAAAKQPSFADWLAVKSADPTKKAGTSSASPAYEYEEVETVEQCLRGISQTGCDVGYYSDILQWRSGLACCNSKYYSKASNTFLSQPEEVGDCTYTVIPRSDNGLQVKENVKQIGSFTAICTLHQNSDECGYPFCDKLVLSVQGQVYEVANAIVSSLPSEPPMSDDSCPASDDGSTLPKEESPLQKELRERRAKNPLFRSAKKKAPVKAAYAPEQEKYYHSQLYKVDYATMYYGAMQVVSREHNVKTHSGWFEHVSRITYDTENPHPVSYPGDSYVLDPYVYKLTFIKNKGY